MRLIGPAPLDGKISTDAIDDNAITLAKWLLVLTEILSRMTQVVTQQPLQRAVVAKSLKALAQVLCLVLVQ